MTEQELYQFITYFGFFYMVGAIALIAYLELKG